MRDPKERLRDMLEAIERIERQTARGRQVFEEDALVQVWVVHHLQVLGEAASRLGREFQEAHREVPWREVVAMRNVLVHEYFGIDLEEVWKTVEQDLPGLKARIMELLHRLEQTP